VKSVLPGHGLPAGPELLSGQAQFMAELYKTAKAAADQGKTVEDAQNSAKWPASVENWVKESSIKGQLKDAYDEAKAGKPRGDLQQ